jgi:hypothetical protein
MQHPEDRRLTAEQDEPDLEALWEAEFAARVELIDEWVKQHYRFATEQHREVLLEAVIKELARCDGILTDDATAVVGRACARAWRKIAREMAHPCEVARTRRPQRSVHVRRPTVCRPRERRDGSRRSTRSGASRGDPSDSDGPGGAGDPEREVASRVAGWSR